MRFALFVKTPSVRYAASFPTSGEAATSQLLPFVASPFYGEAPAKPV